MCQLFAINSGEPVELNPLLREFFSHGDENPHGWGVADLSSSQARIVRSTERADTSSEAERFLLSAHRCTNALAHIRAATIGQVELENCHPFTATDASGRHWTLIHKGTIFDFEPLNPYFYQQRGATDSERILLYLVDHMNRNILEKGAPLESDERFAVFSQMVGEMSRGNCLNLLIFDSDQFFVYTNYRGALNLLVSEEVALFCTSPLSTALASAAPGSAWEPLPLCTPLAFKQARCISSGIPCGQEYFDNEEDTHYLYQDYAGL
ncbi:MAG: class II glutamine amidotransferase [Coriobacteriales bacterium]|jgi:glutamine amidotransferase|nr:class II glutamine amidotransferase [Coriobacteriales bacterium]